MDDSRIGLIVAEVRILNGRKLKPALRHTVKHIFKAQLALHPILCRPLSLKQCFLLFLVIVYANFALLLFPHRNI